MVFLLIASFLLGGLLARTFNAFALFLVCFAIAAAAAAAGISLGQSGLRHALEGAALVTSFQGGYAGALGVAALWQSWAVSHCMQRRRSPSSPYASD